VCQLPLRAGSHTVMRACSGGRTTDVRLRPVLRDSRRLRALRHAAPLCVSAMTSSAAFSSIPLAVMTDSYKACHPLMYPNASKMVAVRPRAPFTRHSLRFNCASYVSPRQYGEFRKGFRLASGHDEADKRIVTYGIRYVVENYLERRWTLADVEAAALFYRCAAGSAPLAPQLPHGACRALTGSSQHTQRGLHRIPVSARAFREVHC